MIRKKLYLLVLFILICSTAFAQGSIQDVIEEVLDAQSINGEEGTTFSTLAETLMELSVSKINVNYADDKTLARIPFLNAVQIKNLIKYRKRHEEITNIYELQLVEGFNEKTIRWLMPFVTFEFKEEKPNLKRLWWNHELMGRTKTVLQPQKGYQEKDSTHYLGKPYQYYLRYIVSNKWGEAGITAENDPGEPFFTGKNKSGFDYYSAHVFLQNIGIIRKLNIGDYNLRFGQGLNLWNGFSLGKSLSPNVGKKYGNGISPYRSINENNFFRGIATELAYNNFTLNLFYSHHKLDATAISVIDSLNNEEALISSIHGTGYHRTLREFEKKHNLTEQLLGANLKYNANRLTLGATAYQVNYDRSIEPANTLSNQFAFRGDYGFIKGLDFAYVSNNAEYFGELSLDTDNYAAWLVGSNFYLDPRVTINMVYRNYHQKYNNFYAKGFGEYNKTKNESGFFTAITFLIHSNWTFSGYADFFQSKGPRFNVDTPSKGNEYAGQLNFTPSRSSLIYLKIFFENKAKNISQSQPIQKIGKTKRTKMRLHFRKSFNQFEIKSNITKTIVDKNTASSHGFLVYQDLNYELTKIPLKIYSRLSFFDTDDFDARCYAYESDVLYAFSFPAYYYRGNRFYIMAKYQWRKFSFWVRYASTQYQHKEKILSGLNEIEGNRVSELKLQVRWKF